MLMDARHKILKFLNMVQGVFMRKTLKTVLTHFIGGFYISSLDCWRLNRRSVSVELTRHDPFYSCYLSKNSIILSSSRCLMDYSHMRINFVMCGITQMTMLYVRGLVSIDTRVEVSIVARSQVSIDEVEVVSNVFTKS